MKIGFVTFCTEDYTCVVDNLVESILTFSKYDVIVNSINFTYQHESNRVRVNRIDYSPINYYNICKLKIYSAINSDFDVALCLDADMIVTDQIDNLFNENIQKVINSDFPLFGKHPHKPLEANSGWLETIKQYSHKIRDNWVFATFLFSNKNKWFLNEVYHEMNLKNNQMGEDELIINGLLSKYGVQYDIGYNFFPSAVDNMFDIFFNDLEPTKENNTYTEHNCPIKFYCFHGFIIKNCTLATDLIERIKNKHNKQILPII